MKELLLSLTLLFAVTAYADVEADKRIFCDDAKQVMQELKQIKSDISERCEIAINLVAVFGTLLGEYKNMHASCIWPCSNYEEKVKRAIKDLSEVTEKSKAICIVEKNDVEMKIRNSLIMSSVACNI